MKSDDIPIRDPEYLLEQIGSDYQLRHRSRDAAIYINGTAALLWELCDGRTSVGDIKAMLQEAYPDAGDAVSADVEEAMAVLQGHEALATKGSR